MLQSLRSRSKRGISSVTDTSLGTAAKVSKIAPPVVESVDSTEPANEIDLDHHHLVLLDSSVGMDTLAIQETATIPDISVRHGEPTKAEVSSASVPVAHSSTRCKPTTRQLYYYQRDTIASCLEALKVGSGSKRFAVSAPAGSGKTETFVSLLPKIPNRGDADKVLILVPSLEILGQVKKSIRRRHRGKYEVDVEHGGNHPDDGSDADIIIATYQSLNDDQIRKYDPALFRCVIVDEAHHAAATSYLRQLHYFNDEVKMRQGLRPIGGLDHGHRVPIIGFSATLARGDRRPLNWVFEKVAAHIGIKDLFEGEFLSPIQIRSMFDEVESLREQTAVSMYAGENTEDETYNHFRRGLTRGKFARTQPFIDLVVSTYLDQAKHRRSTLVFCASTETAASLTESFKKAGTEARYVTGNTPKALRQSTIKDFKLGLFPVLVNCQVFTEGADMPAIDVVILASPTESRNAVNQMLGRGTRLSPGTGKDSCLIIDIFDIIGRFGLGVEPCLWQEKAYEVPPIPKSWVTDSDDESEGDEDESAAWLEGLGL